MAFFSKRGPDIIDYTMLQKKGLIKTKKPSARKVDITRDGYVKLGEDDVDEILGLKKNQSIAASINSSSSGSDAITPKQNEMFNPLAGFDVLGNSSGAKNDAASNSSQNQMSLLDNSLGTNSRASSGSSSEQISELNNLKVKLEDMEYKFDRLAEKFDKVCTKLLEFESKMNDKTY
jgi:hypothetical protein